jgi:hypothetical protein
MTRSPDTSDRWSTARRRLHVVVDLIAFVVESACVGNGVFWFLTWGMLSFDWDIAAREYGRFWTHYANAGAAARHPVELFLLADLVVLSTLVALIRAPRQLHLHAEPRRHQTYPMLAAVPIDRERKS